MPLGVGGQFKWVALLWRLGPLAKQKCFRHFGEGSFEVMFEGRRALLQPEESAGCVLEHGQQRAVQDVVE